MWWKGKDSSKYNTEYVHKNACFKWIIQTNANTISTNAKVPSFKYETFLPPTHQQMGLNVAIHFCFLFFFVIPAVWQYEAVEMSGQFTFLSIFFRILPNSHQTWFLPFFFVFSYFLPKSWYVAGSYFFSSFAFLLSEC